MDGVKIYGLCLERLRHQITKARQKMNSGASPYPDQVLLESYCTGDIEDIIDILELYDVEERTFESVREKLQDLAYTASELLREGIAFDYTPEGHLGIYLSLPVETPLRDQVAVMTG